MSGPCFTFDQAFEAGFSEACEHNVPDPVDCPRCRLTDAEIGRLVVLLQGAGRAPSASDTAAA